MPLLLSHEFISFSSANLRRSLYSDKVSTERFAGEFSGWRIPPLIKRHEGWSTWNVDLWHPEWKLQIRVIGEKWGGSCHLLSECSFKEFRDWLQEEVLHFSENRIAEAQKGWNMIISSSVSSLIGKWLPGLPVIWYWSSFCRLCLPLRRSV